MGVLFQFPPPYATGNHRSEGKWEDMPPLVENAAAQELLFGYYYTPPSFLAIFDLPPDYDIRYAQLDCHSGHECVQMR